MSSEPVRWLKLSFGLAATAGFVWLLAREVDLDALGRAFAGLSIPVVLLALGFLAAGYTVRIVRWWWMLRVLEPSLPLGACVWPLLASIASNNVLPFRAGDAFRVLGFRRQLQSPAARVLGTLVIERVLDLGVLVGFLFLGLLGLPDGSYPRDFVVAAATLAGAGIVAILALPLLAPGGFWERLPGRRFLAGRRWAEAVSRHGALLAEALGVVRSPQRLLALLGLSVLAWACEGAVFVTVAAALQAGTAPLGPWFALATGTLATLLPSSPGYVGTFDYFAAQGLAAYGASLEVSAAFALIVHAVLWAPLTAAGLFYLLVSGVRPRHIMGDGSSDPNGGRAEAPSPSEKPPAAAALPRRYQSERLLRESCKP